MAGQTNLRDQIAARRAQVQKNTPAKSTSSEFGTGGGALDDRTVSGQIRRAAKSGKLDIASFELDRIPSEVYTKLLGISVDELSRPLESVVGVTGHFDSLGRERPNTKADAAETWTESEELTGFKAGNNKITELDVEIGAFGGLKTLDFSGNRLNCLPRSFADLLRLTSIDLSRNKLTTVPPQLLLLPTLTSLDLSHNLIEHVDVSSPADPSNEGLAYGAGILTTSFSRPSARGPKPILPALKSLNLAENIITSQGLEGLTGLGVKTLNMESNKLCGEIDAKEFGKVTTLNVARNPGLRLVGHLPFDVNLQGCDTKNLAQDTTRKPVVRPDKPDIPYPEADLALVYRQCPAATFDGEPLLVDFDLYLPSVPAGPSGHALVIWFHGGGLLQGNKENLCPHLRRLPGHSYNGQHVAVISPNYRLAPQVPIIDILSDITTLMTYVRTELNDRLKKEGKGDHLVDTSRMCLSGGSAGGYLAMIAGLGVPSKATDESVGGYHGESGIKCIAPFYPITDLTDEFWATKVDPAPWWNTSVTHEQARPHLDLKAAPIATTESGGPRSILYPYMIQHALFPSLLFMRQRGVGDGLDAFRPEPKTLSITHRLDLATESGMKQLPTYLVWCTEDQAVQPMAKTIEALQRAATDLVVEKVEGGDHGFDEASGEECEGFREWLGGVLL